MVSNPSIQFWYTPWTDWPLRIRNESKCLRCKTKITYFVGLFYDLERKQIFTVNRTKYFLLFSPTQLFTHGQWWSILRIHRWHTEQWCALSGLMLQHFGHLKNIWPSASPNCSIISLVAFPQGTAPYFNDHIMNIFGGTFPWVDQPLFTGSDNVVRKWDANARKANNWKMIIFAMLKNEFTLGRSSTRITTNSAKRISIHVNIAHTIPHISCNTIISFCNV